MLDRGDSVEPERPSAGTPPDVEVNPLLYRRKGLRVDRPRGWTSERERGVVRLRSGDGRVIVSIAPRPRRLRPRGAARAAVQTVRRAYDAVRMLRRIQSSLGGRPARAVELVARGRRGALVDVLVVGGASEWRSYAVTAVSLRPPSAEALRELDAVVDSIRFVRPPA